LSVNNAADIAFLGDALDIEDELVLMGLDE
jgi:hypothetical protein